MCVASAAPPRRRAVADAPHLGRPQGRVKWEAWESRKGMAQDEAKAAHIKCAGRRRRRPPPPRAPPSLARAHARPRAPRRMVAEVKAKYNA